VIASLAAIGCAPMPLPAADEPVVLRIGLALPGFSSSISVGRAVVAHLLSGSRLLRTDREGRYHSDVARAWTVASDGLSVTFEIRTDACFPDGSRLTAALVKASLDATLDSPESAAWPALENIAAVGIGEPDRVILRLHEPSSVLLADLDLPITKPLADGRAAGVGPFFVEEDFPDRTVLLANPYYQEGKPRIAAIHLSSYASARAAWAAMMRGESDFLYAVPNDAREFLERDTDVTTFQVPRTNVFSLVFNRRREVFDSPAVRRALSMAVDRQQLVDLALRHHGRPAAGFIWPTNWALASDAPSFAYRPADAFRELYDSPSGGRVAAPSSVPRDNRLRFTCLIPEGVAPHDRIAILLQKQLFDVAVDMEIETVPVREFVGRLLSGSFDAALLDLSSGTSLARLYPYGHSSSPGVVNIGYTAADEALDALRTAMTDEAIKAAVRRVQEVFYDDPPAIFLCWPETTRALSRRFVIPDPELDLGSSVARWYPATGVDQGS
jgi:peptide/nickel transport system substrate-binding protein